MNLFSPLILGDRSLRNRVVMAPLTRCRADAQGVPSPLAAEYYAARADAQGVPSPLAAEYYAARADAGLIITEGVGPSPMAMGYARTPAIYSQPQIDAWRKVTEAVHARGGVIFLQMLHVGRIAHSANRT